MKRHALSSLPIRAIASAAACCLTFALASSPGAALAMEVDLQDLGAHMLAQPISEADDDLEELRNPYANETQGYSLLLPGGEFGVFERDGGNGETLFYLKDSIAETQASYGSLFSVLFAPGWSDTAIVDEFFGQLLASVSAQAGDEFTQINEGTYEMIVLGGVEMPAAAWYRYDDVASCLRFEMRAMEVLPGGGTVVWSMSAVNEEIDVTLQALSEAVATFKADPAAYGGASVVWTNASSLASRPAGESLPGSAYGSSSSSGGASGTPTTTSPAPAPISYTATSMTDGVSYYIQVPAEWTGFTEYGGYGESQLLEAYDYYNPAVRMTFWGLQEIPGSSLAAQLAGVPIVMENGTVANFVSLLPQLSALAAQNGQLGMPDETRVLDVEVVGAQQVSAVTDALAQVGMSGMICDESIVLARVILDDGNNTEVFALIYGTVAATGLEDFLSYAVMNVYGIFAPAEMFGEVALALAQSGCGQFSLHERYVQEHPNTEYDAVIYANSYQQWRNFILESF